MKIYQKIGKIRIRITLRGFLGILTFIIYIHDDMCTHVTYIGQLILMIRENIDTSRYIYVYIL